MNPLAVNISCLGFKYRRQDGLFFSDLDLKIESGERFGLFGPNGAGKTTLMNLMTGLISFEQGNIQIAGIEIKHHHRAAKKLLGFVPQDLSFYEELTPVENLEFFGAWSGLRSHDIKRRISPLLEILGLADVRHRPIQTFSGGMKRRVNLAIGVIHRPALLFLDEPTVGVDVQTRYAIVNYLKELNSEGTTLIYTSHQLSEAEGLCEKIALIDEGKIIAHGDLDTLLREHGQDSLEALFLKLTGKDFRNS